MVSKYIVRYRTDEDPRSREVIMLANSQTDAKSQLIDEFSGISDYVNILSIESQISTAESRKKAEQFFI
jgi:hypothetical protein